jgi:hypothetical protein
LPWGLFAFLYLPLVYWSGFNLKAVGVIDFPGIYLGARLTFFDHKTPYGYKAFDDFALAWDRWIAPFVYPPPSLIALWPLSLFTLDSAFIFFTIFSHLCLLGTVWLILTKLLPIPASGTLRTLVLSACVTYILLSDAVAATFNLGQVNIIATFFICLSLAALFEKRPAWQVAVPLSIAILLKTYPLLLIVLLLARRRFRAALITIGCCAVFLGIAVWILPGDLWTSWQTQVLPAAVAPQDELRLFSHSNVSLVWNQSVSGFFTRLVGEAHSPLHYPDLAGLLARATSIIMISVTALFAFRAPGGRDRFGSESESAAAFLLLMYLVAPVSWDHHLVFILPSAALALVLILNGSPRGAVAILLGVALSLIAWRMNLDAPIFKKGWWSLLASLKFFSVAGLWVFFLQRLYRPVFRTAAREDVTGAVLERA